MATTTTATDAEFDALLAEMNERNAAATALADALNARGVECTPATMAELEAEVLAVFAAGAR